MAYVLRYIDEKGVNVPDIEQTFRVLVVAGMRRRVQLSQAFWEVCYKART